ncbi:hypothetical protein J3E68DRAFT_407512 [Trichoderma sp. SZMC 28012]
MRLAKQGCPTDVGLYTVPEKWQHTSPNSCRPGYSSGSLWVVHLRVHPYLLRKVPVSHTCKTAPGGGSAQRREITTHIRTRLVLVQTCSQRQKQITVQPHCKDAQDQKRQKGKYKHDHFSDVVLFLGNSDSRPFPHTHTRSLHLRSR